MVGEVSKIIIDALSMERALYLPRVGSLYVERRPAKMLSSRRLQRASNVVDFSSSQRGRSLVEILSERCAVDVQSAEEVYDRWLGKVSDDDMIRIEGVGVLKNKSFLVDAAFDELINPMGHDVVAVSRYSRHIVAWIVTTVCVVVLGGAIAAGLYFTGAEDIKESLAEMFASSKDATDDFVETIPAIEPMQEPIAEQTEQQIAKTDEAGKAEVATDTEQMAQSPDSKNSLPPVAQPVVEPQPSDGVSPLTSGRHYVVFGIYSTPENAMRAVAQQREKGYAWSGAYNYGKRFLVALYADDDMQQCSTYARQQRETYPNLWIYTAR